MWIKDIDDPLAMPEMEVLRTRVWPPDGKQPTTSKPIPQIARADSGAALITLTCNTPSASLGYRKPNGGAWHVYTAPFEYADNRIELVSHRIGWKPSRVSTIVDRSSFEAEPYEAF